MRAIWLGCETSLAALADLSGAAPVVAINHTAPTLDYLLHVIRYDSTHGTSPHADELSIEDGALLFRGRRIALFSERDPTLIDWSSVGAEYIVESTGKMKTVALGRQHIDSGKAKKVIISAPSKDAKTFVYGVNHEEYVSNSSQDVVSNASCTVRSSLDPRSSGRG